LNKTIRNLLSFIFRLIFCCRQFLRVRQVVNSDGQEDVEQGVVAEERQYDEVERVNHSGSMTTLRLDALVHHLVPVFTGQDLFEV